MNLSDYFIQCEKNMPQDCTSLRRTSFALRRAGVNTMEKLCDLRIKAPDTLANMREIGHQSLALIDEVIHLFKAKKPDDATPKKPPPRGS